MIADKKSYQAGDVAKVLIITGVPNAKVLFSREGRSLGEVKVVEATGSSVTVEVPIATVDEPVARRINAASNQASNNSGT